MISLNELAYFLEETPENLKQIFNKYLFYNTKGKNFPPRFSHSEVRKLLYSLGLGYEKSIFTIAALKGGIGKTFLSTHVAVRASMLGAKVLLVDLDPEACATNTLLTEDQVHSPHKMTIYDILKFNKNFAEHIMPSKYEGLDIIPSSLRVSKVERMANGKNPKTLLRKYVESLDYDFIFFELPPSFSTISGAAYLASDLIVIPCTPSIYSLESVDLTIEAINELSMEFDCDYIKYKILFNMYNPKRSASQDTLNILVDEHGTILYPFRIRDSAEIQNAINAGITIFETKCSKNVREGLEQFVKKLCMIQEKQVVYGKEKKKNLDDQVITQFQ